MAPLRVGILGAGLAAEGHAAAYHRLPDVRVAGIWNRSRGRAKALASRLEHEPRLYDRWQDMISDDQIDVISIATAPLLRSAPARSSAEIAAQTRSRPLAAGFVGTLCITGVRATPRTA
jgi:predicted dehydrogenase